MSLLVPILAFFPLWIFRSNLGAAEAWSIFVLLFLLPVFLTSKIISAKHTWSVTLFKVNIDTRTLFVAFLLTLSLDHNLGLWGLTQMIDIHGNKAYLFGEIMLASIFLLFAAGLALNFQTTLKVLVVGLLAIIASNLILGEKDIRKLNGPNFVFDKSPDEVASKPNTNPNGPTVVIILDEMVGIEGIDLDQPNGPETYNSSRALFKDFGFKAYGSAYSIYGHTLLSIPATLNLILDDGNPRDFSGKSPTYGYKHLLRSNKFFDQSPAHEIEVFQTYYLNFCQHPRVTRCNTFTSFERPSGKIENFDPGLLSRVTANYKYNTKSIGGYYLHRMLLNIGAIDGLGFPHHDKAAFENNLIKLQKSIIESPGNRLIFAHYMVPHRPFGFTKGCTYQMPDKNQLRRSVAKHRTQHHQEIMCVNRFLRGLFEGLRSAGVLDQLKIVIFSDHGPRLSNAKNAKTAHDTLVAGHSSLFAVRVPGVNPGYDAELHSIQYLFSKYMNANHREQIESHLLFKRDQGGKRIRMPKFAKVDLSHAGNGSQP